VALASSLFGGAKAPIPLLNALALDLKVEIQRQRCRVDRGNFWGVIRIAADPSPLLFFLTEYAIIMYIKM
jgi:hypothetical protein